MVKKADRLARAATREARRLHYARQEAVMQSFLRECRAALPAAVWDEEFSKARRCAGSTSTIAEWMVQVLARTQLPVTPPLRQAIEAMLEVFGTDHRQAGWNDLRRLNYGAYWKSQYGYDAPAGLGPAAEDNSTYPGAKLYRPYPSEA